MNRFLREGKVVNFEGRPGMVVRVVHGTVWLTQYRDPTDYLPRAGDEIRLKSSGPVVASGLTDASLWLEMPERALGGIWAGLVSRFA